MVRLALSLMIILLLNILMFLPKHKFAPFLQKTKLKLKNKYRHLRQTRALNIFFIFIVDKFKLKKHLHKLFSFHLLINRCLKSLLASSYFGH